MKEKLEELLGKLYEARQEVERICTDECLNREDWGRLCDAYDCIDRAENHILSVIGE